MMTNFLLLSMHSELATMCNQTHNLDATNSILYHYQQGHPPIQNKLQNKMSWKTVYISRM